MPSQKAFSLFELLITLTILTLTATLTIPNFKSFLTQTQNVTFRTQLQHALAYAKSQAMLHGVNVALCGADKNHQQCAPTWREGIIIFTDETSNAIITHPEQILHIITNSSSAGFLKWRSSFAVPYLQFQPAGMTNGENGTFWYCDNKSNAPSWALVINLAGRARVITQEAQLKKLSCA